MQFYLDSLAEATQKFQETFQDLTPSQMNWKPNAGDWSIGQIIDHIITTNETYYPVFEELRSGTHKPGFTANIPFLPGFFGRMLVNSSKPSTSRKMKTVPVFEPTNSEVPMDILSRFVSHQAKMADLIQENWDLINEDTIISSPANKYIVYSTQHWIDLVTWHEHRHFNQARAVWDLQQQHA